MVKKVERDGKIGVLISCGYGAGWSTWCGIPDKVEEMVFSPEIIELVERGAGEEEIIQRAKGCICEKGGGRKYRDVLLKKVKDITVWDLGKYIKKGVGIYFVDSKAKKEWLEVLMK